MPYIGKAPNQGVRNRFIYQATAGQTNFTGSDANSLVLAYADDMTLDCYQNGVLLQPTIDYSATTGSTVVLTTGASLSDVIEIIAYDTFTIANSYTKDEADARYPFLGNNSLIRTNGNSITADVTIPNGTNGLSAGPITVSNATITINGVYTIV